MTMYTSRRGTSHVLRPLALALGLLAAGSALAAVGPAGGSTSGGGMNDIPYGNTGNIFELSPQLFVQGLGSAANPESVVALNPALSYSFGVSGAGTGHMTIDYRIHNGSAAETFNQLRFALFINPDGDQVNFLDTLQETWGAAAAGDPDRREGRAFTNPADTIVSSFQLNGNLTDGLRAECLAAAGGCDATAALQWNAASLSPGETFLIRIGLADDGSHLSSRWLEAHSVEDPSTVLTFSGVASVTAVPLPGTALLMAPVAVALGRARRRRAQPG